VYQAAISTKEEVTQKVEYEFNVTKLYEMEK
jgi:hypothetical protein